MGSKTRNIASQVLFFAGMSRNKLHFFVCFTEALVSQGTHRANFAIYMKKMKTKSFDVYSEEIKRNEVLDIP